MNRSWNYPYKDLADRDDMLKCVRDLARQGHNVRAARRQPPGRVLVQGDKDGLLMAGLAKPIRGFER